MERRADQRKYHYIYKIHRDDGRYYVGMHSTDDIDDGYFGSGKKITRSIKKHGLEKHKKEILEFCASRDDLKSREKELVNEELLADPLCMNLTLGGHGGWSHLTDAQLAKGRLKGAAAGGKVSGKINGAKNLLKAWEQGKVPVGKQFLGKKHSEETKQKMRKPKNVGEANSQFGTCWVTNGTPIKIKKEQLDEYLLKGYRRGRK